MRIAQLADFDVKCNKLDQWKDNDNENNENESSAYHIAQVQQLVH